MTMTAMAMRTTTTKTWMEKEEKRRSGGRRRSQGTSSAAPGGDYDNAGRRFGAVKIIWWCPGTATGYSLAARVHGDSFRCDKKRRDSNFNRERGTRAYTCTPLSFFCSFSPCFFRLLFFRFFSFFFSLFLPSRMCPHSRRRYPQEERKLFNFFRDSFNSWVCARELVAYFNSLTKNLI